jgi:hypothetical protein
MLDSRTFRMELLMLDVFGIQPGQISKVRQIIMSNKNLTINALSKVSIPAAALLAWAEAVIVWHEGRDMFGASEDTGRVGGLKVDQISNFDRAGGVYVPAKQILLSESKKGIPQHPPRIERPPSSDSDEHKDPTLEDISSLLKSNRRYSFNSRESANPSNALISNRPSAEMDSKLSEFRKIKQEEDQAIDRILSLRLEDIDIDNDVQINATDQEITEFLNSHALED